jgi:biopolymer transport protein ExbD
MSHGPTDGGDRVEPDLTALLDLVFQLLMYFIVTVKFTSEQVPVEILLPEAQSAKPGSKDGLEPLFLNIDYKRDRYGNPVGYHQFVTQINADQRNKYSIIDLKFELGKVALSMPPDKTAVIIRAHKDVDYAEIYRVLAICKDLGYKHFKLKAIMAGG